MSCKCFLLVWALGSPLSPKRSKIFQALWLHFGEGSRQKQGMPKSSCTLCSRRATQGIFAFLGCILILLQRVSCHQKHVNLLDAFKICFPSAVSAEQPSLWVACGSLAGSSPAKPHCLACLNKGRWLMRSVKEALAMLGGQPKENKGMGAVTFMAGASRNKTACSPV